MKTTKLAFAGIALSAAMMSTAVMADFSANGTAIAESQIKAWAQSPAVIGAIKTQNAAHANLSAADIDKLDKEWRADKKAGGNGALIQGKLNNALAGYLNEIKSGSNGLIAEIFVMDNKGLNVGQTDKTGDYMQGDEAKHSKTYGMGPGAVLVSAVEEDGGKMISQVSVAITDPKSLKAIGAVTVAIDTGMVK